MASDTGKFAVSYTDRGSAVLDHFEKDAIVIGRLASCDIVLTHKAVSRIHAGINYLDGRYFLINLSASNVLTLNGRLLSPHATDALADGDIVQIGPFAIVLDQKGDQLLLSVTRATTEEIMKSTRRLPPVEALLANRVNKQEADVLKVFWEKRTRDKEDWGSLLRPTEKPQPGKAVINWKPTRDLRRPWRVGLFVWAFLVFGAFAAFAYMRYPDTYAPKPLANPHAANIEGSPIAARANGNSCTTCHMANAPIENACITCHQAEQFHVSNTKAHEEAGITCTACHKEHRGHDFDLKASAIQSCAECHNDNNKQQYNGKGVRTAHGGSYGYPLEAGVWKWKGVYKEVADAIPEIKGSATGDANEQARLSRHFHSIHVYRLKAPEGMKADKNGLVSCSTCHNSFDPIDRETAKQTCATCHTTKAGTKTQDTRFAAGQVNCISCHVQHPFSGERWSEFLTADALERRKAAVSQQIKQLNGQ
jgi:pSer/pThr/pTyr-binding forkhead associated (FHA) protein